MINKLEKKRFGEIGICKGLGIILVVLGHALKQTGSLDNAVAIPLSVIYSFHMPLFFLLSGFLSVKLLDLAGGPFSKDRLHYIGSKAVRLLVPYFVMSLLYLPLKLLMNRVAIQTYEITDAWRILIGDSPNTSVWFLYILFFCCAVAALLVRRSNLNLVFFAAMLFSSAAYALGWQIRFPRFFIYFIMGLLLRENDATCRAVLETVPAVILSALFFVIGNVMGFRHGGLWFFLTSVTGCHLMFCLADFLNDRLEVYSRRHCREAACRLITDLMGAGKASMDIYIFSDPVMTALRLLLWNVVHLHEVVCIAICFVGGLLIPIPLCRYVIRKVKVLRLLFLGER